MIWKLLTISSLALMIADLTPFVNNFKLRYNIRRIKPLDCSLCLSFWIGVVYILITKDYDLAYITIPPVLTLIITKWLRF